MRDSPELESLGWSPTLAAALSDLRESDDALTPARVAVEYQDRLLLWTSDTAVEAFLSSRLRDIDDRLGRPAVGDWVATRSTDDGPTIVHHLLPRRTVFVRRAAGDRDVPQVVAANIDVVAVVTSLNKDFNINRLERYLTATRDSGAEPLLVLNKADLDADHGRWTARIRDAFGTVEVVLTSALAGDGVEALRSRIGAGQTAALVGSSGVGKSTLLNRLIGNEAASVGAIRGRDDRGRHTTRNRSMHRIPGGGVLIDTPGMREIQPWSHVAGGDLVFDDVERAASGCRFRDCTHGTEPGCTVRDMVESGRLDPKRVAGYQRMMAEVPGRQSHRRVSR